MKIWFRTYNILWRFMCFDPLFKRTKKKKSSVRKLILKFWDRYYNVDFQQEQWHPCYYYCKIITKATKLRKEGVKILSPLIPQNKNVLLLTLHKNLLSPLNQSATWYATCTAFSFENLNVHKFLCLSAQKYPSHFCLTNAFYFFLHLILFNSETSQTNTVFWRTI